jgi:anti-sigma regulatory factor (Ser/Thr protein kinase)
MRWQCYIPSTKEELQTAKTKAMTILENWGISEEQLFDFNLVLCELLVNAGEHGNLWQRDKKVFLNMRYCSEHNLVLIFVADEGKRKIRGVATNNLCSERGRGLLLLSELTDHYRVGCGRVWVRKEIRNE